MTSDAKIKSANTPGYAFRPAVRADLPLLRRWLRTPEVLRWWGDAEEQEALLREDFAEPTMVMRIVSFDNRPFAYAQDYEVMSGRNRISRICPMARAPSTPSSASRIWSGAATAPPICGFLPSG